ncbi:hypothetical protein BLA39750_02203 [Burkholderia lata]|uniref:Uncharacterized protein n=1 Tax=Burkholderia lata (strain ATCC 17760 / DSM 23089 / LMG 22485 / NCIMB 9086 / R18194 / 383) TaxID=482957 RepID=A0A6P2W7S7_BURL3|nr:hypothetical protein [Burkholderia lata]VWC95648.1 hypothetical protein BLA39750_02203 [Burkholderia lata]
MQLTDWFPPDVRPVHAGWYDRDYDPPKRDYWDGEAWRYGFGAGFSALPALDLLNWRGLAYPYGA